MEVLTSNNNYEYGREDLLWGMIEDINWYTKSKHHNRDNANEEVANFLKENYTIEEIIELENFVVNKRERLKDFVIGFLSATPKEAKSNFRLGDDNTWDLCSHIVGLGRVMYSYVIDHPHMIFELQKDFVENFEYGFTAAVYELSNK